MNPLLLFCIHLLFERVNQSWIIGLNPKVSVPSDWTDLRWPRRIMFFEGSEFFSMSRRNEKFHRKASWFDFGANRQTTLRMPTSGHTMSLH